MKLEENHTVNSILMDGGSDGRISRLSQPAIKNTVLYKGTRAKCLTYGDVMEQRAKRLQVEDQVKKIKEAKREERERLKIENEKERLKMKRTRCILKLPVKLCRKRLL